MSTPLLEAFAALQEDFAQAEARTSGHIERPPNGTYDALLTGIEVSDTPYQLWKQGSEKPEELPGRRITFQYRLLEDPLHEEPLEFPGDPFRFPISGISNLPKNYKQAYDIAMSRLKGHLQVLCDHEVTDLVASLSEAMALVEGSSVIVQVTCKTSLKKDKQGNERERFTDTLAKLVST